MLSSPGALLCFIVFIYASTSDGSMDGGSTVDVIVGSSCESWAAEALLDLYSSLYNSTNLSTIFHVEVLPYSPR